MNGEEFRSSYKLLRSVSEQGVQTYHALNPGVPLPPPPPAPPGSFAQMFGELPVPPASGSIARRDTPPIAPAPSPPSAPGSFTQMFGPGEEPVPAPVPQKPTQGTPAS